MHLLRKWYIFLLCSIIIFNASSSFAYTIVYSQHYESTGLSRMRSSNSYTYECNKKPGKAFHGMERFYHGYLGTIIHVVVISDQWEFVKPLVYFTLHPFPETNKDAIYNPAMTIHRAMGISCRENN